MPSLDLYIFWVCFLILKTPILPDNLESVFSKPFTSGAVFVTTPKVYEVAEFVKSKNQKEM
ncbi:hypothetical protein BTO14_11525 [Polaribacter butkevichii]|uniref:Uncharacterized protein n=1 Tax=Polaribacter butkevichii TaxID=218490 RepID=A0A2P6C6W7_9FLAO|nr:hypothetical protein BTO14_11525 [Polaribacter butkevichii]